MMFGASKLFNLWLSFLKRFIKIQLKINEIEYLSKAQSEINFRKSVDKLVN